MYNLPQPIVLNPDKFNAAWLKTETYVVHGEVKVVPEHPCRKTFEQSAPFIDTKPGGNAVDIGARYGEFTRHLLKRFNHVYCFEPRIGAAKQFEQNAAVSNVSYYNTALGDYHGTVIMHGGVIIDEGKEYKRHETPIHPLDAFEINDVRYIKIDVEGFELFVLKGAERTIMRDRPLIVIEQNESDTKYGHSDQGAAQEWLEQRDYVVVGRRKHDVIMVPKEKQGD